MRSCHSQTLASNITIWISGRNSVAQELLWMTLGLPELWCNYLLKPMSAFSFFWFSVLVLPPFFFPFCSQCLSGHPCLLKFSVTPLFSGSHCSLDFSNLQNDIRLDVSTPSIHFPTVAWVLFPKINWGVLFFKRSPVLLQKSQISCQRAALDS